MNIFRNIIPIVRCFLGRLLFAPAVFIPAVAVLALAGTDPLPPGLGPPGAFRTGLCDPRGLFCPAPSGRRLEGAFLLAPSFWFDLGPLP